MSTYANVLIENREFNVRNDGGDKETIRDCIKEYVDKIKSQVKSSYLVTAVIDAIVSESAGDYYAPFALGYCEMPDYQWTVQIGPRGSVTIYKLQSPCDRQQSPVKDKVTLTGY